MAIVQARHKLASECVRGLREGDGCLPEADDEINDASRNVVQAFQDEHGEAWLGLINVYSSDKGKPVLWKWDGSLVLNFSAGFVVPKYDADLERLIHDRHSPGEYSAKKNRSTLEAITIRIEELGGVLLLWT